MTISPAEIISASIMVLGVFYLIFQIYTSIKWKGKWRNAALAPLVITIPVIIASILGFLADSNLWPLYIVFIFPLTGAYLLILGLIKYFYSKIKLKNN